MLGLQHLEVKVVNILLQKTQILKLHLAEAVESINLEVALGPQ